MNNLEILIMEKTKEALQKYLGQKEKNRNKTYMHITNTSSLWVKRNVHIYILSPYGTFPIWTITRRQHVRYSYPAIIQKFPNCCIFLISFRYFLYRSCSFSTYSWFFSSSYLYIGTTFQTKWSLLSISANTF
jgi:hypothetical protein